MMWNARVNAICDRAHGTGSTARARSSGIGSDISVDASRHPRRRAPVTDVVLLGAAWLLVVLAGLL